MGSSWDPRPLGAPCSRDPKSDPPKELGRGPDSPHPRAVFIIFLKPTAQPVSRRGRLSSWVFKWRDGSERVGTCLKPHSTGIRGRTGNCPGLLPLGQRPPSSPPPVCVRVTPLSFPSALPGCLSGPLPLPGPESKKGARAVRGRQLWQLGVTTGTREKDCWPWKAFKEVASSHCPGQRLLDQPPLLCHPPHASRAQTLWIRPPAHPPLCISAAPSFVLAPGAAFSRAPNPFSTRQHGTFCGLPI